MGGDSRIGKRLVNQLVCERVNERLTSGARGRRDATLTLFRTRRIAPHILEACKLPVLNRRIAVRQRVAPTGAFDVEELACSILYQNAWAVSLTS